MSKELVIGGRVMRTAQDVLDHYAPEVERVLPEVWRTIRPLAVKGVTQSTYKAPTSVHFALRITARFLAWTLEQGIPLDAELVFTPQRVEQYIAEGEASSSAHSQGNYRAALTNVGKAITKRAPWEPDRTQYTKHIRLAPPYTEAEIAGYWDAVEQQSAKGAHILRSMLVFAHGAGLKVTELMDVSSQDIYFLKGAPIASIKVPGRIAPVLSQYTDELRTLCAEQGSHHRDTEEEVQRHVRQLPQGDQDARLPAHPHSEPPADDVDQGCAEQRVLPGRGAGSSRDHERVHAGGHRSLHQAQVGR